MHTLQASTKTAPRKDVAGGTPQAKQYSDDPNDFLDEVIGKYIARKYQLQLRGALVKWQDRRLNKDGTPVAPDAYEIRFIPYDLKNVKTGEVLYLRKDDKSKLTIPIDQVYGKGILRMDMNVYGMMLGVLQAWISKFALDL